MNDSYLKKIFIFTVILIVSILTINKSPFYTYIDEGHILLWTDSFYLDGAPKNIFYGPLLFYIYSFFDFILQLFSTWNFSESVSYMVRKVDILHYQDYRSYRLILIGRVLSAMSYFYSVYIVFYLSQGFNKNKLTSLLISIAFASQPWLISIALRVQPEIYIVFLLLLFVFILSNDCLNNRQLIKLLIIGTLMASLKIYGLVFSGLICLILFSSDPIKNFRKYTLFIISILALTIVFYFPYRDPGELWEVINIASAYYDHKPPTVTIIGKFLSQYQYLVPFSSAFLLLFISLSLKENLLLKQLSFLFVLVVFYFSQYPFANLRNLVFLNIYLPILLSVFLMLAIQLKKTYSVIARTLVIIFIVMVTMTNLLYFPDLEQKDNRNNNKILDLIKDNIVYADTTLQYPSFLGIKNITKINKINTHDAPSSFFYFSSKENLDKNDKIYCNEIFRLLGNKEQEKLNFFIMNPSIFINHCSLKN